MSDLWLIGTGDMGLAYAHVLASLGAPFAAIGRGPSSAQRFSAALGQPVRQGGLASALASTEAPHSAIVALPVLDLGAATRALLAAGTRRLLVEKPVALDRHTLDELAEAARRHDAQVFVAYNRRFYASVLAAERILADDGGLVSFSFEFTEWSHVIEGTAHPDAVKQRWVLANSTHVIDLAFFLGGAPASLAPFVAGALSWHPTARFCGAGVTTRGATFSYHADWDAPGRWGLELLSTRSRLTLRPLEKLSRQARGSVAIEPVAIDDALDTRFKPGLHRQVQAFLGDGARLCTLAEHAALMPTYEQLAGYPRASSIR